MSGSKPPNNLAARMGRWSADHWKTATFGWLAFVVLAFGLGGMAGTKKIDPNTAGPGESGRMDRILDAGFKRPADETVLIQSGSLASATRPSPRRSRTSSRECRRSRRFRTSARLSTSGNEGQIAQSEPRCARRVRDPRRKRRSRRQDRPGPRRRRRSAERAPRRSSSASSAMRAAAKAVDTAFADDLARPACSRFRSR